MKKNTLLVTIALLFTSPSFAELGIKSDVIYGHKDGMALVYSVLQPENANGAAIVFMVSGGWYSRWSPPQRYATQFEDMLDAGFTVIPVHHGSAPRYRVPEAYADVSRAIRHIKLHAQQHGIDPDRIGVTGGSAGGHLSLMLGLDSDADTLVDISNSVDMQAEFEKHHITSEFITISGAGHGFRGDDAVRAAALRLDWFKKYLL